MGKIIRHLLPVIFLVFAALSSEAQSTITTYAGLDAPHVGFAANTQSIDRPIAILAEPLGGFSISSLSQSRVYHVSPSGSIDNVIGSSYGFSGDGGAAQTAQLRGAFGVAVDSVGNTYIADTNNHRIRKVSAAGFISTVAGTGKAGFSGDGGAGTAAQLQSPSGLVMDFLGNLFIADQGNNRVRMLTPDGTISTVAGNGAAGSGGDGGLATAAQLNQPMGVALDRQNNLIISEFAGHRVRRIVNGVISTVAGTGTAGYSGDGGIGPAAQLNKPAGLAVDSLNNLYIADSGNHRVRIMSITSSVIGILAGDGTPGFTGDGDFSFFAEVNAPMGLSVDGQDNLYIADTGNNRVRLVSTQRTITTVFGNGTSGYAGDSGLATLAQFDSPRGVAMDQGGTLYIADTNNNRIRKVTPTGFITTFAGNGFAGSCCDGGSATSAQITKPYGVAVDPKGNVLIADTFGNRIRKVDPATNVITNLAGYGSAGFGGDGDLAIYAIFNQPRGVAADALGNVYIADTLNNRIRQIDLSGKMGTIAGTGVAGFSGDGGSASTARLNNPSAIAIDGAGNIYIADTGNGRVRKIDTGGRIFTIAGSSNTGSNGNGDGLGATAPTAFLSKPTSVAVDARGNVFISELDTGRVRVVTTDGIIRTAVGNGILGYSGDNGSGTDAQINGVEGLGVDAAGNLFIGDTANHRVRRVINPAPPIEGQPFAIASRGGLSLSTLSLAASTIVGYGRIQSTDPALAGLAIFGYRPNGVLISEAAVPATRAISSGRIYAFIGSEVVGNRSATFVNTGVAIANPNDTPVDISYTFTGSANLSGATTLPARSQIAAFLDQSPFNAGSTFDGTFTFTASQPVAVAALRGLSNQRGEFLVTTLPVVELGVSNGPVYIPHFADGGGWATQIALINPTDVPIDGTIQFLDPTGNLVTVTANGVTDTTFRYSIRAREAFRLTTSGLSQNVRIGSVRVTPSASSSTPTGAAIFSYQQNGITVTEASVRSMSAGTSFRMYAEASGNFGAGAIGSIQSGIAIANLSSNPVTVNLTLDRLDGTSTGLTAAVVVPGNGQVATFLNQIQGFASLSLPFQGVLRATSTSPIAIVGLRGRYNERSEFLITTTAAIDEGALPPYGELFFPHIADSGGYTTQFILMSGAGGQATGSLRLVTQTGLPLSLTLH
jgi:sugar lactone lactonase YvrE